MNARKWWGPRQIVSTVGRSWDTARPDVDHLILLNEGHNLGDIFLDLSTFDRGDRCIIEVWMEIQQHGSIVVPGGEKAGPPARTGWLWMRLEHHELEIQRDKAGNHMLYDGDQAVAMTRLAIIQPPSTPWNVRITYMQPRGVGRFIRWYRT